MTKTAHDSFTIERIYDAPRALVYDAWSKPELRQKWFAGGGKWTVLIREQDFRVGGQERVRGQWENSTSDFRSVFHDIVPNERIIFVYDMYVDDRMISVSTGTVELFDAGSGTRMRYTEQGVFLDYDDNGSREHGTNFLLDRLGAFLDGRTFDAGDAHGTKFEKA